MKSTFIKIMAALGLIAALASCNKSPEKRIEKISKKITKKLDLDETQKKKLNILKTKIIAEMKQRQGKQNKEVLFEKINTLMLKDKITQEEVLDLVNQKQQRKREFVKAILPELTDFHASLNLEQKQKISKFSKKLYKKFSKHWKFKRKE